MTTGEALCVQRTPSRWAEALGTALNALTAQRQAASCPSHNKTARMEDIPVMKDVVG